jgi:hypothetical protein
LDQGGGIPKIAAQSPVTTPGTASAGQVAFFDASTDIAGDGGFVWNNTPPQASSTNKFLSLANGVALTTPGMLAPYALHTYSAMFNGVQDDVSSWAYNNQPGTVNVKINPNEPLLKLSLESNFDNGPQNLMEYNFDYFSADGSTYRRFMYFWVDRATHLAQWRFAGEIFQINQSATGITQARFDKNVGLQLFDVSQTSEYFRISKSLGVYLNRDNVSIVSDSQGNRRVGLVKQAGFPPEIRYSSTIPLNFRRVLGGTLENPTGSDNPLTVAANGNVGIGTNPGTFDLEVGGNTGPSQDNFWNSGTNVRRWHLVRGVSVVSGDLGFEEQVCPIDGKPFKAGDKLTLLVKAIHDYGTLCIPIHWNDTLPRGWKKTFKVPKLIQRYVLDETGIPVPVKVASKIKVAKPVKQLKTGYEFHEDTRSFLQISTAITPVSAQEALEDQVIEVNEPTGRTVTEYQLNDDGSVTQVEVPETQTVQKTIKRLRIGYQFDTKTGNFYRTDITKTPTTASQAQQQTTQQVEEIETVDITITG